jgi:hypothetical protein
MKRIVLQFAFGIAVLLSFVLGGKITKLFYKDFGFGTAINGIIEGSFAPILTYIGLSALLLLVMAVGFNVFIKKMGLGDILKSERTIWLSFVCWKERF